MSGAPRRAAGAAEGAALHLHYREAEELQVVAGTLSASVEGRQIQAGVGETAIFESGAVHRWWNDGDDTLVLEGYVRPAVDLDRPRSRPGEAGDRVRDRDAP